MIPKEFHPRYDGRKPKAKVCGTLDVKTGVYLNAGSWQVDVGEGQCLVGLGHGLPFRMTKGLLEFFLLVLRRISEKLALPVYVAPHAVGLRIHEVEDLELLQLKLRTWKSWPAVAAAIQECQQLFVPVVLENTSHSKDIKDCVLLVVSSAGDQQKLGDADDLRIRVFDVVNRAALADHLSARLAGVVWGLRMGRVFTPKVHLQSEDVPECTDSYERVLCMLGVLLGSVLARATSVDAYLDQFKSPFLARRCLAEWYGSLRDEADRSGVRDVLRQLLTPEACKESLGVLTRASAETPRVAPDQARVMRAQIRSVEVSDFQPLKFLTWNVSAFDTSAVAPAGFSLSDKKAAMQLEILGWEPDVLALQECNGMAALPLLTAQEFDS